MFSADIILFIKFWDFYFYVCYIYFVFGWALSKYPYLSIKHWVNQKIFSSNTLIHTRLASRTWNPSSAHTVHLYSRLNHLVLLLFDFLLGCLFTLSRFFFPPFSYYTIKIQFPRRCCWGQKPHPRQRFPLRPKSEAYLDAPIGS